MKHRLPAVVLVTTAVCVSGCGDDLSPADASVDGPPCVVPTAGYGALLFTSTNAARRTLGGVETVAWLGAMQSGPMSDLVDIQLIQGNGVFAGGLPAPGTYELTGAETQLLTCGACVVIHASVPRQYFVAQSGTLVVDELGPTGTGQFRGSLANVTFVHVTVDSMTTQSTVIDDGCHTSITAASWSTPIN